MEGRPPKPTAPHSIVGASWLVYGRSIDLLVTDLGLVADKDLKPAAGRSR